MWPITLHWPQSRFKVQGFITLLLRPTQNQGHGNKTRQIKGNLAGVDVGMSHLMSKQLHNYRSVPKWEPLAETAEEKEIRIRQPAFRRD
jgi:hypothetical protein